ncbi:hypothetical protein C9374_006719 [Naegleria lovaniensis]|uniref:Enoyl reductase (ER) domain-containing protein n=1 Tax=Naegleria lovaniensis TaxID=51637 RepID=A0AA88KGY6_NAELO|nr:uncharacterized protein C9374_006719 [Naegleria lovaniensis]KAG2379602.1 hypothetical protein C9374_006719 [Naegleria lovaniensis]
MRAAVLHQLGSTPVYTENWPEPPSSSENDDQELVQMKASAVKNLDKYRASGKHYASYTELPVVVGMDGVGKLQDGTRVYGMITTGTLAERVYIPKNKLIALPDEIDDVTAAALPNAIMGAYLALFDRGLMKKGDVVLINGATGVTGRICVQLAKYYGASKVIATGRNQNSLNKLQNDYGADQTISLLEHDEHVLIETFRAVHELTPIDVVIDYLWGHPMELILRSLKGSGMHSFSHKVRVVTVGSMAGEIVHLPSSILRSSAIEICGSGFGSFSNESMKEFHEKVLPEMFKLAGQGIIKIDTEVAYLKDIESVWNKELDSGKRLVIKI